MKLPVVLLSLALGGALSGCAVKYGCPAPDGVTCKPISEVYSGNGGWGPGAGGRERPGLETRDSGSAEENLLLAPGPRHPAPEPVVPLRSAPKVLRVWVAPWIDEEGDLHQEGDLYVVVDHGAWAVGLPAVESGPTLKPGIISGIPESDPLVRPSLPEQDGTLDVKGGER